MKKRKIQNGEEAVKYCYLSVTPDSLNIPAGMERDHGSVGRGKAGDGYDPDTLCVGNSRRIKLKYYLIKIN